MNGDSAAQLPFDQRLAALTPVAIRGSVVLFAALTVASGLYVSAALSQYPPWAPLHHDLTQPVLALELPATASDLRTTIFPPGAKAEFEGWLRDMFRSSLRRDFTFIPSYAGLFALSLWSFGYRRTAVVPVLAGALDIAENVLLLGVLDQPLPAIAESAARAVRLVSLGKWACIAVSLLAIGWALTNIELRPFRRPGTGLLALFMLFSGVVGVTGVLPEFPWPPALFTHRHIEVMVLLSAVYPLVILLAGVYNAWLSRSRGAPSR